MKFENIFCKKLLLLAILLLLSVFSSCMILSPLTDFLGLTEAEEGNDLTLLLAALVLSQSSSGSSSTSPIDSYCASSSVVNNSLGLGVESTSLNTCWTDATQTNDAGLPSWIKDNFYGMTITVNGSSSYDFATGAKNHGRPPHKSGYYTGDTNCQEDYPSGNSANPNAIADNDFTLQVPQTPNSTETATSPGKAGVTVNGVIIFNDTAAPGDSLATELATMDQGYGHPQNTGTYHYHTEPCKITRNDSSLLGIAADGYAIYGRYDSDGSLPTLDANNFHSGSTGIDGNSTGHYHVESSSMNLLLRTNLHGSTL